MILKHRDNFFFIILETFITFLGCRSERGFLPSDTRNIENENNRKIVVHVLDVTGVSIE